MIRSANPALSETQFQGLEHLMGDRANTMTIQGAAVKTGVLVVLALISAGWTWDMVAESLQTGQLNPLVKPLMWGGLIAGFLFALITIFKKTWAPFTAPLYALSEGLFLGAVSSMVNAAFQGIVIQAVGLTFGILAVMCILYATRTIKVTGKLAGGIMAATFGVMLMYLVNMVMGFFGAQIPYLHDTGPIGIGISAVIVVIASLNLLLDFDLIETQAQQGAPKYMEWYGAFALMVTLVWLYIEVLHLLSKLQSRD